MSAEEGACPGTFFQPAAAGDEVDVTVAIQCLLFVEDAVGKVTFDRIYDIEKTVVDIVFYREKIGIEETKEVLTTYLNRSDRNLNRLIRYAELLKCGDVMKKYLEVLV